MAIATVAQAWLCSRMVVLIAGIFAALWAGRLPQALDFAAWDGLWYRDIAQLGYEFGRPDRQQTAYPFFPLLPALMRGLGHLGWSPVSSVVLLNPVLFAVGLLGLWSLTRQLASEAAAVSAVWVAALLPGSLAYSMVYPEAILFAAAVLAYRLVGRGEPLSLGPSLGVGLLGLIATLVRPNGLLVPLALTSALALQRRGTVRSWLAILAPACLGLGIWMAYLWLAKDDPLIWIRAKAAWHEVTLWSWLDGRDPRLPWHDVLPVPFAVLGLLWTWRLWPLEWKLFALAWLGLPLLTGIVGWPRYAASCFPVSAALGVVMSRWSERSRQVAFGIMALWLARYSFCVLSLRLCP